MNIPKYLRVIEYTAAYENGCTVNKVAMFNETVISAEEVQSWIQQGVFEYDRKPQVVVMTKKQYENLYDHITSDKDSFYEDLVMEQKEQM